MKTISKLILIQLLIVIAMLGVAKDYLALAADITSSITASGTRPLTPGALLDDFRYAAPINIWGAQAGAFSSSTEIPPPADASCTASYTNDPGIAYGGSGYSLKLDYNISSANSFAGYYSKLGSASLSGYTAVSFYVKGAIGGEFFKIQIKNKSATQYVYTTWDNKTIHYYRNKSVIYVTDYLDGGVTTTWQKVTIPFDNFANLDGWSSMEEFVIVFENAQSLTNGSPTQGTIYIDNITFETSAVTTVRADHFGDKLGVCALGGNMGTATGSGGTISYSFSNGAGEYSPYVYGLRLNYNVTSSNAWAATYLIFGGGNDAVEDKNQSGWIAVPHDFNAYNYITLRVRAKSDAENPKAIKIELVDSGGSKYAVLYEITTDWKLFNIPLSAFGSINKASIKQLTFVADPVWINTYSGNKAGTVYIDTIQFEQ